jgi:uncharacterized protein (DUF885 family)
MSGHPVFVFGDALARSICEMSPILATFSGVKGHDDRWDDVADVAGRRARYDALSRELSGLEAAHAQQGGDVGLSLRVMREHVDERRAFYASGDPYLDLNHISSTFQMLPMVFDVMDTRSPSGVLDVVARLLSMGEVTESYRRLLEEGLRRGDVVARRQVEAAIRQGRAQAIEGSHYRELVERIATDDASVRSQLNEGAEAAHRAITALTEWLTSTYLPRAAPSDGVGRERYARAARRHLGTALDLDETHAWGFAELARIEAEMARLAAQIGTRWGLREASPQEVVARLDEDAASSAALPEPFLTLMRERQEHAMRVLAPHFAVPDLAKRLDVKLGPEGGPVGAYYIPPSEDGARAGSVFYLPGSRTRMPLWQEITTAYHEGFPGHHLQIATQLANADRLTRFQRLFADWNGYAEGWALYAEQLMLELGLFEEPEYELGMYAGQLARACRVVVDIGLHLGLTIPESATFHPGEPWTVALALEMMEERAVLGREKAESEVTRYLGWPAQAITYKVGQRAMLTLREARRAREGAAFDLARFHRDVLATGTVGLDTLEACLLR